MTRLTRDDWNAVIGAVVFAIALTLASAALADAPKLPLGVSCADVRAKVAEYGKPAAFAWALGNGYSLAQIREARRCLR